MTELNNSDLPKSGSEVIDSKGFMTRAWYTYFRKLPGSIQSLLASVESLVVDVDNLVPNTRRVDTAPPLSGGGELTADLTITTLMATDRLIGRDTAGLGVMEEIAVGGGVEFTGSGGIQRSALTGDVTASAGSDATTIANNAVTTVKINDAAVTYAKIQDVSAASKLLGRGDSGSGDVQEITLGSGLSMSGTTLSSSGGSASAGEQIGFLRVTSTTARSTTSTTIPADNTIPQNTEGTAYTDLDLTYTPLFSNSLLEITLNIPLASHSASGNSLRIAAFRDSGADAVYATFSQATSSTNAFFPIIARFVVSAGSTSSTTFTWRWGVGAGTGYIMSIVGTQYFSTANFATATIREIKQ